ncbi:MAG: SGNH/GDSL hydrolase family protein [Alphaproteobacteria bacterium]
MNLLSTRPRTYLAVIFSVVAFSAAIAAINYVLLYRAYEIARVDEVVSAQLAGRGLYGPATENAGTAYKLELYNQTKPAVVAIGSSRAMRFRQAFFNKPFTNMGGAISDPKLGIPLLKKLQAIRSPDLVILTIDPWWFTPRENIRSFDGRLRVQSNPTQEPAAIVMTTSPPPSFNLFLPVKWLFEGKIRLTDYWPLISRSPLEGDWFPQRLGVLAYKRLSGFAYDGSSYHDAGAVVGLYPADDRHFSKTFSLVNQSEGGFECGQYVDQSQWQAYQELLSYLRDQNIPVVAVLPPLAGALLDHMYAKGSCYKFIDDLRQKLVNTGIPYFDFYDMRQYGVTDCEFLDGYHPGDTVYARMLKIIADSGELPVATSVVDRPELDRVVREYSGRAMIMDGAPKKYKEVDFLDLKNCPLK